MRDVTAEVSGHTFSRPAAELNETSLKGSRPIRQNTRKPEMLSVPMTIWFLRRQTEVRTAATQIPLERELTAGEDVDTAPIVADEGVFQRVLD